MLGEYHQSMCQEPVWRLDEEQKVCEGECMTVWYGRLFFGFFGLHSISVVRYTLVP